MAEKSQLTDSSWQAPEMYTCGAWAHYLNKALSVQDTGEIDTRQLVQATEALIDPASLQLTFAPLH